MNTPLLDNDDGSDDSLLAAQYVLGTLSPAERLEFQTQLQQQPALRTLTHAWERRLNPLADRNIDRIQAYDQQQACCESHTDPSPAVIIGRGWAML